MCHDAAVVRDAHATQRHELARAEGVYIEAVADPHRWLYNGSVARIIMVASLQAASPLRVTRTGRSVPGRPPTAARTAGLRLRSRAHRDCAAAAAGAARRTGAAGRSRRS